MPLRPSIQRRVSSLDLKTQRLFQTLEQLAPDLLERKPRPDYWNVLEAANHIYLGEKLSLQYVKYKVSKPDTVPPRRPDAWIRSLILKGILYSKLKVKSPPQINMRNDQPLMGLSELKRSWQNLRAELEELLEKYEDGLRNRLPYKQPFLGRMTLSQMLIFFEDHLMHHTRQIRHIIKQVSH